MRLSVPFLYTLQIKYDQSISCKKVRITHVLLPCDEGLNLSQTKRQYYVKFDLVVKVMNVVGIDPRFWNMAQVPLDPARSGVQLYKGGHSRSKRIRQWVTYYFVRRATLDPLATL